MTSVKQVIVDSEMLVRLAANETVVKEFPFLRGIAPRPDESCTGCAAKKARAARLKLAETMKTSILALPVEKRDKFKSLLGARQLVLLVKTPSGVIRESRF